MTDPQAPAERTAFEAWWFGADGFALHDERFDTPARGAWAAWQARASQPAAAVAVPALTDEERSTVVAVLQNASYRTHQAGAGKDKASRTQLQAEATALFELSRKFAAPASAAVGGDARRVVDAARAAMDASTDSIEAINLPSHLAAALSLALDDFDAAMAAQASKDTP